MIEKKTFKKSAYSLNFSKYLECYSKPGKKIFSWQQKTMMKYKFLPANPPISPARVGPVIKEWKIFFKSEITNKVFHMDITRYVHYAYRR